MHKVPIAFAFDNNLILPACVCISSLLMNANEDTYYDIFILHSANIILKKKSLTNFLNITKIVVSNIVRLIILLMLLTKFGELLHQHIIGY